MKIFRNIGVFSILFLILLFTGEIFSQKNAEYFGKFDTMLVPDTRQLYRIVLKPAEKPANYKFSFPTAINTVMTDGKIFDLRKSGARFNVVLFEFTTKKTPQICVDINTDDIFDKKECFVMTISKANSNDFEYLLNVPIKTPLFNQFPIFLRYKRGYTSRDLQANDRVLMHSLLSYAVGKVNLETRPILVQYMVNAENGTVSTTNGIMGIDGNGDGKIKNEPFSNEISAATDEEIIFRVGEIFVSTSRADTEKNQIVMRKRRADEYRRIEIEVGKPMPDFSFTDFDSKKRTLAEFRGKFVLVDFWGVWCVDCRRQIPFQVEAYQKFRERGFEILGMDTDQDVPKILPYLQKYSITWTQARFDSIKELVENRYRIQEYPSAVLLDADGKVLIIEQSLLKGDELLKTLDRILPPNKK